MAGCESGYESAMTVVILGVAAGHGGGGGPLLWIVIPFMVLCAVWSVYQLRRGGRGPGVGWIPSRFRPKLNEAYRQHGWQEPFDENGRHTGRSIFRRPR
jgi:hypothetical protein